jgi:CBS domain-containing protein
MANKKKIREIMTSEPVIVPRNETLYGAARAMKDNDIGAVLVEDGAGGTCGIVTDRDLVVRGLAMNGDSMTVGDVCTTNLFSLSPDQDIDNAVKLMAEHSVRRVPVMDGKKAVGIVSLGDLACIKDDKSVLAGISAASANN